jgi:uncharacterized protein YoxC
MKKIEKKNNINYLEIFANCAMNWIGSISSLVFHTILFMTSFALIIFGIDIDKILLVVTTVVSLEAIYLAIFIQMGVNKTSQSLNVVEENIDEIQEDVEEIQKDVDEIQKDVDEIQEDVEEITEDEEEDENHEIQNRQALSKIETQLQNLIQDIEKIKNGLGK